MSTKNLAGKIEKEITRVTESLVTTVQEYIEAEVAKATKIAAKTKNTKTRSIKNSVGGPGRPAGGGLLGHIVDILKENNKPLTEADIAKILLDHPEKYNWKSKSETTLYQTLRRAVKDQKIAESGDRSKETKTYRVA